MPEMIYPADDAKILRKAATRLADWNDLDLSTQVQAVARNLETVAKQDPEVILARIEVVRALQPDGTDTWRVEIDGEPLLLDGLGMLRAAELEFVRRCTGGCPYDFFTLHNHDDDAGDDDDS